MPETRYAPPRDAALTPQGPPTVAALQATVDALARRVQAIEERLRASLSRADRERLARLLPAWSGTLGSSWMTAREVVEHPSPALRLTVGGLNARSLGRLASRATGIPVGGLVIESGGMEGGVGLWSVRAVIE